MAAATLSIAPPSSSSISLQYGNQSITQFPPISLHPTLKPSKTLKLISSNFTLLTHLPLHLCRCSAISDDAVQSAIDDSEADTEVEIGDDEGAELNEEDGQRNEQDSADACRLYVGNLPYSTTSSQLAEIFGESGHVRSAEIIYDRLTDRSRGFAFVTMDSVEEAQAAIRMFDGTQIGGRTVKVNVPEVPRGGERKMMGTNIRNSNQSFVETPHRIYAGNLDWSLTSQGLRDTFAGQPGFISAKVIYDRDTGRSRGFGFVSFASAEELESALNAMNGLEVVGRPLRLNMAAERAPPASTETVQNNLGDSVY